MGINVTKEEIDLHNEMVEWMPPLDVGEVFVVKTPYLGIEIKYRVLPFNDLAVKLVRID